jgi:hypothetical protein
MNDLVQAFLVFNQNGFAFFFYAVSNSLWFVLIGIAAVLSVIIALKEQMVVTVREEQQVI